MKININKTQIMDDEHLSIKEYRRLTGQLRHCVDGFINKL